MRETRVWLDAHRAAGYVVALGLTAIVTGAIAAIEQIADVANISMLYLFAVMASAIAFGSGPAILSSIAAFLVFDFFFVAPRYTATVSDPEEWVALGLLLVTGVITGQLAAALRERAREAGRREREAMVLYDVVRLMTSPDLRESLAAAYPQIHPDAPRFSNLGGQQLGLWLGMALFLPSRLSRVRSPSPAPGPARRNNACKAKAAEGRPPAFQACRGGWLCLFPHHLVAPLAALEALQFVARRQSL